MAKVGGSVYLVDRRYASGFRELLGRLEGPELSWHEFQVAGVHGRALR